jgi:hypothetical protein
MWTGRGRGARAKRVAQPGLSNPPPHKEKRGGPKPAANFERGYCSPPHFAWLGPSQTPARQCKTGVQSTPLTR